MPTYLCTFKLNNTLNDTICLCRNSILRLKLRDGPTSSKQWRNLLPFVTLLYYTNPTKVQAPAENHASEGSELKRDVEASDGASHHSMLYRVCFTCNCFLCFFHISICSNCLWPLRNNSKQSSTGDVNWMRREHKQS